MSATPPKFLLDLVERRRAAENETDKDIQAEQAQQILISLLTFTRGFMGNELLAAAYGGPDECDRSSILKTVASRSLLVSMVFAGLPDDAASLERLAEEAMAVAQGDAPVLLAKLPSGRKRAYRVTRSKFEALTWDAYLEGSQISPAVRHGAISIAFGHDWDTISRWIKPARSLLGDQYVAYHLALARAKGAQGNPYTLNRPFAEINGVPDETWEQAVQRDGKQFLTIQRENAAL